MGGLGRPVDNGSVVWAPLHVTSLASVAEQGEGVTIRARKLREKAERCPSNSAARGVAEEALLRFGGPLKARAAELKAFYESNILEDVSVLFERERLRILRLLAAVEAPLLVRPPIKALPVNAPDPVRPESLGALMWKKTGGPLATVHSAPSTPKGTSRRHQSFVPPPDAPPVLQLPAKPALRLLALRANGATSPRGGGVSPRGAISPRTGSPPPSSLRPGGPMYVPSPLQGVSFPEPPTPPAAPSGRKHPKKHSFALPNDAFLSDAANPDDESIAIEMPSTEEGAIAEQDGEEPGTVTGHIDELPTAELGMESRRAVELVVKLTAEEYEELMVLARERTREA